MKARFQRAQELVRCCAQQTRAGKGNARLAAAAVTQCLAHQHHPAARTLRYQLQIDLQVMAEQGVPIGVGDIATVRTGCEIRYKFINCSI